MHKIFTNESTCACRWQNWLRFSPGENFQLYGIMCKMLSYLHCMHVHVHTCSSLEPLFENSRLDEELRQSVKKTFPEFCRQGIF